MAKVQVKIPTFKLKSGEEIPAVGFGTWLGLDEKLEFKIKDAPKMLEAVMYAIDVGYRHIDTAHLYRVEPEVGYAVRKKIEEGVVKREDLFITTKVWQHNHRPEDVEASVRASLKRMGLQYLDQVLIHWPMAISEEGVDEKIDYLETYRGLEAVLKKGLTRYIGVSNFNLDQMKRLLANCSVKPTSNQIQVNLNLLEDDLVKYCQENDVLVVSYTSFGSMISSRTSPGTPEPRWDSPIMHEMSKKYGKTASQIALRFLYQRGIATIPKSLTPSRIIENASIFDFNIDEADIATLEKFNCGYRTECPVFFQNYTHYPFDKVENININEVPISLRKWKNGANLDIE
ncbi:aldo-keto reductase AKR2E4-like [Leptidea sinapis]|uniref:aldo-keto reductase AKR2E4-like n=1 Tax=Leptidea sinapis TaxID=189913 RepID=UPI0021374EEC|nr:aldo-keto reductase AKR2E4-like [Leptidea sinapis]